MYGHPNVHGTFVSKTFIVTHFTSLHFTSLQNKMTYTWIMSVNSTFLHFTSLHLFTLKPNLKSLAGSSESAYALANYGHYFTSFLRFFLLCCYFCGNARGQTKSCTFYLGLCRLHQEFNSGAKVLIMQYYSKTVQISILRSYNRHYEQ